MSILILAGGVGCAWFYLRKPAVRRRSRSVPEDSTLKMIRADRPWRRVGAAICLVLSVMFVLGVYLVDIPQHPRTYAVFWLVMMVLVVWLCVLALKDVLYTRRILAKWRADRGVPRDIRGAGGHPDAASDPGSQEARP